MAAMGLSTGGTMALGHCTTACSVLMLESKDLRPENARMGTGGLQPRFGVKSPLVGAPHQLQGLFYGAGNPLHSSQPQRMEMRAVIPVSLCWRMEQKREIFD